jgi:hypothetical protein
MHTNLLKTFKRKIKFRRKLTDYIMFGPLRWCGLTLHKLCFKQDLVHFKMLFGHLHQNNSAASVIHACLSALQLETGLVTPILSSEYITYSLLCLEGWIKMTWKFLADSMITVLEKYWNPRLLREGNVSLMGFVVQQRGEFTGAQVLAINRCCVYLQVISIADMTNNDVQFILK